MGKPCWHFRKSWKGRVWICQDVENLLWARILDSWIRRLGHGSRSHRQLRRRADVPRRISDLFWLDRADSRIVFSLHCFLASDNLRPRNMAQTNSSALIYYHSFAGISHYCCLVFLSTSSDPSLINPSLAALGSSNKGLYWTVPQIAYRGVLGFPWWLGMLMDDTPTKLTTFFFDREAASHGCPHDPWTIRCGTSAQVC